MGVPQFLKEVLKTAGRKVDLRYYEGGVQSGNDDRRPLKIGVDISSWIYKACQGFSDMLGDERHLTNYGRATLANNSNGTDSDPSLANGKVDEQALTYVTACAKFVIDRLIVLRDSCKCTVLVVLDGATPPIKLQEVRERSAKRKQAEKQRDEPVDLEGSDEAQERRLKAFRRAGAGKYYQHVVAEVTVAMRQNEMSFLVAPYESDGQLAFLLHKGYIDLIVTEDSDLAAYGASPILYKLSESIKDGEPRGILLRAEDLASNAAKLNLMDFSPAMLTVLFVAAGSDYCKKLKGIGIVSACNIVRHAFLSKEKDPLAIVFEKLLANTWDTDLTAEAKEDYRKSFLAALLMFRHPVVFDPINACCVMVEGLEEGGDPELRCHAPYAELLDNMEAREQIVGSIVPSPLATYIAEGWISARTHKPHLGVEIPDHVRRDLQKLREPTSASDGKVIDLDMETQEQEEEEEVVAVGELVVVDSSDDEAEGTQNDERKRKLEGSQVEASKRAAVSNEEVIDLQEDEVIDLQDDHEDDNLETQAL